MKRIREIEKKKTDTKVNLDNPLVLKFKFTFQQIILQQ